MTLGSQSISAQPGGGQRQRPPQGQGQGQRQRPGGRPGGGGGQSGAAILYTAVKLIDGQSQDLNDVTLVSTGVDESALRVNGNAKVGIIGLDVSKPSGDVTNEEASNFYALGAVIAAAQGAEITVNDGKVSSSAKGANAFFSYGEKSVIRISQVEINTTANSSRGLFASYGGTIYASNVVINTQGAHCTAMGTDRGGGLVSVENATGATHGQGSPCIYSTGDIVATNVRMEAFGSEAGVIEGKNSITLKDCDLKGYKRCGVMLYQSMSGDAGIGVSVLRSQSSKISAATGPSFFVTNTHSEIYLTNTELENNGCIAECGVDRWGREGSNGGHLTITASKQNLEGSFKANAISTMTVILESDANLKGCLNAENTAGEMNLVINSNSRLTLVSDCHLNSIQFDTDVKKALKRIDSCGFDILYDSQDERNTALDGKVWKLGGGGELKPGTDPR